MVSIARTRKQFPHAKHTHPGPIFASESPRGPRKHLLRRSSTASSRAPRAIAAYLASNARCSWSKRSSAAFLLGPMQCPQTTNSLLSGEKNHTVKCIVPFGCPEVRRDASAANAVRDNCDNASLRDFMIESSCSFWCRERSRVTSISVQTSHHLILGERCQILNVQALGGQSRLHVRWHKLLVQIRAN